MVARNREELAEKRGESWQRKEGRAGREKRGETGGWRCPQTRSNLPPLPLKPPALQVLVFNRTSYLAFFNSTIFLALWLAQRLVLLAFWINCIYCSTHAFRPQAYDPEYILKH
jgi:hypothetical protein